jgi:hypothetical protein
MSGSSAARGGILLGVLALAAIPAGVAASWRLEDVGLLRSIEVAVPAAFVLGLVAVAMARRARYAVERSIARRGARLVRVARTLAWGSLFLATSGAIALGFYGALVLRGG